MRDLRVRPSWWLLGFERRRANLIPPGVNKLTNNSAIRGLRHTRGGRRNLFSHLHREHPCCWKRRGAWETQPKCDEKHEEAGSIAMLRLSVDMRSSPLLPKGDSDCLPEPEVRACAQRLRTVLMFHRRKLLSRLRREYPHACTWETQPNSTKMQF